MSTEAAHTPLVLITGASGYVGSCITLEALQRGYSVRLVVRRASQGENWLKKYPQYADKIETSVVEDLIVEGAFDRAVQGVDYIIHAASPIVLEPKSAKDDVIDPAIQSTLHLLKSAKSAKPGLIKAFAYTSSMAAHFDMTNPPPKEHVVTHTDWFPMTYDEAIKLPLDQPVLIYSASKTLAEKAAWDFIKSEKPPFTMTSLAPGYVLGYNAQPDLTFESAKRVSTYGTAAQLLDRDANSQPLHAGPYTFSNYVNSMDVAKAHISALIAPEAAGKRYLLVGGPMSFKDIVAYAQKAVPNQASRWSLPKELEKREEKEVKVDASPAEKDLGFKYTSAEETVKAFAEQLLSLPGASHDA